MVDSDLADAARLLTERHRVHLHSAPLLSKRFTTPEVAESEVAKLLRSDGSSGAVAIRDDVVVGYMIGTAKDTKTWGSNVWVESAGYAAERNAVVADLYAALAAGWGEEGRNAHYVVVPAIDEAVGPWFGLGFGLQHVHAAMPSRVTSDVEGPATIRRATKDDIEALVRLDVELPHHLTLSPTFSRLEPPVPDDLREEWLEDIDSEDFYHIVAEVNGVVVGAATGCDVKMSGSNASLIAPDDSGLLGYAAVDSEARGNRVGVALGQAINRWARESGYEIVATDWRATNPSADRAWRRMGFQPTFYRLHRAII